MELPTAPATVPPPTAPVTPTPQVNPANDVPKDAKLVAHILKSMGVEEYEPRVVNQLLEFMYRKQNETIEVILQRLRWRCNTRSTSLCSTCEQNSNRSF